MRIFKDVAAIFPVWKAVTFMWDLIILGRTPAARHAVAIMHFQKECHGFDFSVPI